MAASVQSYKDLVVWQEAIDPVSEVYPETKTFPKEKVSGLTSQIRRAAVSMPSSIAAGHQRLSRKEYQYFLSNARGSLAGLETQILIAGNLQYLDGAMQDRLLNSAAEVGKILNGLLSSLRKDKAIN